MKPVRAAVLFLGIPLAALAQDPYSQTDPFESRFKTHPNFQIKFHVPEKGGEVRLYTKNPVHFEKDLYWEGSEDVVIEYQDLKITADAARYDFPTKTAILTGHVVIDQGPTRISGARGTFHLDTKTGVVEESVVADLPPSYHIVADQIEKIGDATYRVQHGLFTSCDLPKPPWSFTMKEATVTIDDYARMKDVAFRAGDVPLFWSPYLIWPTKENRASGFLVPGLGYNNERGFFLGLNYYWVTGRSTDLTTQLAAYTDGTIGLGEEARWRPTDESAGIFQGFVVRDQDATICVPIAQAPPVDNGVCTLPNGSLGVYTTGKETRWKLRLDHVSDDLPYDIRGVVSIRAYSDEEYLQDFEKNFNLNSARQIPSFAYLTKNFGADSMNLRLERTETFYAATVIQERLPIPRVLPPHGADRRLAVLLRARVLALGPLREQGPGPAARVVRPLRRRTDVLPADQDDLLALGARAGGRTGDRVHGLDGRRADAAPGRVLSPRPTRRRACRSSVPPSPGSTTCRSARGSS